MIMPGTQAVPSGNQSENHLEVVEVTQDSNPQQMTGQQYARYKLQRINTCWTQPSSAT